jgi:hypothetical protein
MSRYGGKRQFFLVVAVYHNGKNWRYSMLIAKQRNYFIARRFGYPQFKKMGLNNFEIGVKKELIDISELSYRTQKFVMKKDDNYSGYILIEANLYSCRKNKNSRDVIDIILSDWRFKIDMLE